MKITEQLSKKQINLLYKAINKWKETNIWINPISITNCIKINNYLISTKGYDIDINFIFKYINIKNFYNCKLIHLLVWNYKDDNLSFLLNLIFKVKYVEITSTNHYHNFDYVFESLLKRRCYKSLNLIIDYINFDINFIKKNTLLIRLNEDVIGLNSINEKLIKLSNSK